MSSGLGFMSGKQYEWELELKALKLVQVGMINLRLSLKIIWLV
jgi:hypothetical protein